MIRKAVLISTATLAVWGASGVGLALAAGHDTPGTAGEPNCHGQTAAWANQEFDASIGVNGLGNVAKALGISMKELQDAIDELCTPP